MIVEVIVTSLSEAILAEKYGANRLELIASFTDGGLSPNLELSREVSATVKVPVNVMLRPHGKNFIYDKTDEIKIINELIFLRDQTMVNGIVFGALYPDRSLNLDLLKKVIELKQHLSLTFHRAIDVSNNPIKAYQELLQFKEVELVLTSGGMDSALNGIENIQQMLKLNPKQEHAKIIAGSGITPDNANTLIKQTLVTQIHLGHGIRTNSSLSSHKFLKLMYNISKIE